MELDSIMLLLYVLIYVRHVCRDLMAAYTDQATSKPLTV